MTHKIIPGTRVIALGIVLAKIKTALNMGNEMALERAAHLIVDAYTSLKVLTDEAVEKGTVPEGMIISAAGIPQVYDDQLTFLVQLLQIKRQYLVDLAAKKAANKLARDKRKGRILINASI